MDTSKERGAAHVRLADFGFASPLNKGEKLSHGVGSRFYIAPEILNQNAYDHKIDVWSATIVIYILVSGEMPYNGNSI